MRAPRAVPDTNVLVAAVITPRGLCGRLLDAAIDGRWQLVVSPQLLADLEAVLARDKFRRWLSQDEASRRVPRRLGQSRRRRGTDLRRP